VRHHFAQKLNNPGGKLLPEMFVFSKSENEYERLKMRGVADPARTALLGPGKRSVVYVKVPNSEYPAVRNAVKLPLVQILAICTQ